MKLADIVDPNAIVAELFPDEPLVMRYRDEQVATVFRQLVHRRPRPKRQRTPRDRKRPVALHQ